MVDEKEEDWIQEGVIHCPIKPCKGMLLQNPYRIENKCSNCGKLFMNKTLWIEVKSGLQRRKWK